jgi:hypothetical protein
VGGPSRVFRSETNAGKALMYALNEVRVDSETSENIIHHIQTDFNGTGAGPQSGGLDREVPPRDLEKAGFDCRTEAPVS